jgi:RNA polymerase sigma factor FliA
VAMAIDQLPERLRLVLALHYQDECSLREIGEVLGVTESRVCQLHAEAVHLIRAKLENRPRRMPALSPGGRR